MLHELGLVRVNGDHRATDLRAQEHQIAVHISVIGLDLISGDCKVIDCEADDSDQYA
jgi:hypothetical protein